MRRLLALLLLSALAVVVFAVSCGSPLVAPDCREGFTPCAQQCVDIEIDHENCGSCGVVCTLGVCVAGVCQGTDAGFDGGPDVDASSDASITLDGTVLDDAAMGDAGPMCMCDLGQLCCETSCVNPDTNRQHCGTCNSPCASDEVCASGTCEDACDAPLTLCSDLCVDTESDPEHCGECDNPCASGICTDGSCASPLPGHVIVIGHDYRFHIQAMRRVIGNAVAISTTSPVEVVVYEGASVGSSLSGVTQAIDDEGPAWNRTVADADQVPLMLEDADAFIISAQHGADNETLNSLGEDWTTALASFLGRGKVIVLLETQGTNNGTYQILSAAGLFTATSRFTIDLEDVNVVAPGDALAVGVNPTYRAQPTSVHFVSPESGVVISHPDGPVVFHNVVTP